VDVVEELDYAVELVVLATPAIVIGGRLAYTGTPDRKHLRELISEAGGSTDA
jgi:protein-disulfide isomerase